MASRTGHRPPITVHGHRPPSTGHWPRRLDVFPLVVIEEVQAGATEMDVVFRDLVPEQAPGCGVVLRWHVETACKIAQPRDDDERHLLLALTPLNAADVLVRMNRLSAQMPSS